MGKSRLVVPMLVAVLLAPASSAPVAAGRETVRNPMPVSDGGSLDAGRLRRDLASVQKATQFVVRYPATYFAGKVLWADELIFERGAELILTSIEETTQIQIIAGRMIFEEGGPEFHYTISLAPIGEGSVVYTLDGPPGVPGAKGRWPGGQSARPGGHGGDGGPGGTGRTLHRPKVQLVVREVVDLGSPTNPPSIDLRLLFDGPDGGRGGDGGKGGDGGRGGRGRHAKSGTFDCKHGPGRGGRGGDGGDGGDGGPGAPGGNGADVDLVGTQAFLDVAAGFQVFQRGGAPGFGGSRGLRGAQGPGGKEGRDDDPWCDSCSTGGIPPPGTGKICYPRTGPDGKPGADGDPGIPSTVPGQDGQTQSFVITSWPF